MDMYNPTAIERANKVIEEHIKKHGEVPSRVRVPPDVFANLWLSDSLCDCGSHYSYKGVRVELENKSERVARVKFFVDSDGRMNIVTDADTEAWLRKHDFIDFIPDSEGNFVGRLFSGMSLSIHDGLKAE